MPSSHLILCHSFSSCPRSLPASGSFPMSQLFASGGQSIGVSASASVLPMNTQDWSPLGWTGWIPLQSKGLSRIFSNTTVLSSLLHTNPHRRWRLSCPRWQAGVGLMLVFSDFRVFGEVKDGLLWSPSCAGPSTSVRSRMVGRGGGRWVLRGGRWAHWAEDIPLSRSCLCQRVVILASLRKKVKRVFPTSCSFWGGHRTHACAWQLWICHPPALCPFETGPVLGLSSGSQAVSGRWWRDEIPPPETPQGRAFPSVTSRHLSVPGAHWASSSWTTLMVPEADFAGEPGKWKSHANVSGGCLPSPGNALRGGGHIWEGFGPAPGPLPDCGRNGEPAAQCQERGGVRSLL